MHTFRKLPMVIPKRKRMMYGIVSSKGKSKGERFMKGVLSWGGCNFYDVIFMV